MDKTTHTIKEGLEDKYEYVEPIPSLNLPELEEVQCIRPRGNDYELFFYVRPKSRRNQACDACGSRNYHGDGYSKDRKVSDISIGLKRVYLQVQVPRYKCQDCGHKFSHSFNCILPKVQFTNRLYEQIQRRAFLEPFNAIAKEYGISIPTISAIITECGKALDKGHPLVAPRVLGLDEKHIEHRMRAVYVDIEEGALLEMSPDNKGDTVRNMIMSMEGWENIEVVTTDMAQGYRPVIEELLPKAKIVVDKYHVVQQLYIATRKTRTTITELSHKEVAAMPAGEEKELRDDVLRRAGKDSYLFKFSEGNVMDNPSRKSLMADLCEHFPNFNMLRLLKDGFMRIYACESRAEAEETYQEWEKMLRSSDAKIFAELHRFGRTVKNWKAEIFQYFEPGYRFTNAAAEGLNSLLQAINSQGRGYSFEVLRLKALYRKEAALPERTITKKVQVFNPNKNRKPGMIGDITIGSMYDTVEKRLQIQPRGAKIDKLLSIIEESGL